MQYFHPHRTEIKYVQNEENTCVFNSLNFASFAANEFISEHAVFQDLHNIYYVTHLVI